MSAFSSAISDGLSVEDAMNAALSACSDEQERQQFLTEVLASQYGELGDAYSDANEDIAAARKANDDLLQSQSELAEKITPLQTAVTSLAADGIGFLAEHLNVIVPIAGAAAVAIGAVYLSLQWGTITTTITTGLNALRMALTGISVPVLAVVAAIAALTAGFLWAYNNVEPFRQAIDQFVVTFQQAFAPVIEQLGSFLTTVIIPALGQFAEFAGNLLVQAFTFLGEVITTTVIPMLTEFGIFIQTTVIPALSQMWSGFSANILPILQQVAEFVISNVVPAIASIASWIISNVVPALSQMWSWFSANILPILKNVWSFISGSVIPIFASIASTILGTVIGALQSLWGFFSGNILPILQQVWGAVQDGISKFGEFASGVGNFINDAKNTVENGLNAIKGFFSGLQLKLPDIKLPHFTVSGGLDLSVFPPRLPSIGVEWYAKGGILTKPTVFGYRGGNVMVGGEAGREAVLPIDTLQGYIDAAFQRNSDAAEIGRVADAVYHLERNLGDIIAEYAPRFPDKRSFNRMVRKAVV